MHEDVKPSNVLKAMEREKARLLAQAASIDRDMAELTRLAAKYNLVVSAPGTEPAAPAAAPVAAVQHAGAEAPRPTSGEASGVSFDGTVESLVECYLTDPKSPFRQIKHSVRNDYEGSVKRIATDLKGRRVVEFSADDVRAVYDAWAANGKLAMANSLIGKLRLLSTYGTVVLNNDGCIRLSSIMNKMRFKGIPPRTEKMTRAHAEAIRAAAHELNWGSIALAQALQFDLNILQKDVVGEWVPLTESGESNIVWGKEKWIRGLQWSQIGDDLIVRHSGITRRGTPKEHVFDLNKAPMVLEELKLIDRTTASGPLIVCEATGLPFSDAEFRRKWRVVADKAGVPKNVRNADSARAVTDEGVVETKKADLFVEERSVH